ncbi:hypothetical protein C4579_01120 [Candidatus Microgenomates bacterium]|nr:MAG: hypothetical protein C4579_01120 [Candidatus Microgenomates bacterium]
MWLLFLIIVSLIGHYLTKLVPWHMPNWARILIGPSVGIIITTELILVSGLVFGLNKSVIATTTLVLLGIILFTYRRKTSVQKSAKEKLPKAYLFVAAILFVFAIYIFTTKVMATTSYGLVTGTGGLWADTAMHSAFTMSLVEQGLPAQNPLFAGHLLVYPFLVNLFSASLILLGAPIQLSFIIPHLLYFSAFLALFFLVGERLVGKKATLLALLIFLFGWGLGWTTYLQNTQTIQQWFPQRDYTNNHGIYNMHNVLTGLIFPERSMLPGLVIGLLITYLVLNYFSEKKPIANRLLLIAGILLGISPLWHTHTFLFFTAAVGIWLIIPLLSKEGLGVVVSFIVQHQPHLHPPLRKGRKNLFLQIVVTFVVAGLLALPVIIWFGSHATQGSFIHFTSGWMQAKENFILFWFVNTGLLIPLAAIGLWKLKGKRLYFLPAVLMFVVANVVMFQPWDWDNIKLFSWVFLFFSFLAGFCINQFVSALGVTGEGGPPRRGPLVGILGGKRLAGPTVLGMYFVTGIILISLIATGILSNIYLTKNLYTIYDREDQQLADWVISHTNQSDTFLIDPWVNHPLPGLTGRSAYIGYPGQLWVHGIDYGERELFTKEVLAGNTDILPRAEVPIDYIVVPKTSESLFQDKSLQKAFTNQKFLVFKVLVL